MPGFKSPYDSASNITITKIIYKNNCALADQSLICHRTLSNVDSCKNNVIYMSSMVQWWKHLKSKLMIWVHTGKVAILVLISARFAKFEFISARFAKFWVNIGKIRQVLSSYRQVCQKATKNKKEHINIQLFCSCNSTPLTNPFLSTTSIYTIQRWNSWRKSRQKS